MKLIKLGFGWKLVLVVTILVIFILGVTIDIITNWTKKPETNTQLLLIGSGLYTMLVIGLTSHGAITLVSFLGIITMMTCGSASSSLYNRSFKHDSDSHTILELPWQFYFILAISITMLILAVVWSIYNRRKIEKSLLNLKLRRLRNKENKYS